MSGKSAIQHAVGCLQRVLWMYNYYRWAWRTNAWPYCGYIHSI